MTNWREHLRAVALVINILGMLSIISAKGEFMSMGLGIPLGLPPLLAIAALLTRIDVKSA
jgi:hypothetical protein